MLVFDNARILRFSVRVIHNRNALIVGGIENLRIETHRAIFEFAEFESEKLVYHTRIYRLVCDVRIILYKIEIIRFCHHVRAVEQLLDYRRISADRYALIAVVEIVVVKGESARQTLYYERGQVFAISAPLLFGVTFDEFGIYVRSDEFQCLFFEVFRLVYAEICHLFGDFGARFVGCDNTPQLAERVHIERQIVQFAFVVCNRRVYIVVEIGKFVDKIPHFLVGRMENVRAVAMHVYALDVFGVDVAADVVAFFKHENAFALFQSKIREHCAEQSASHYEIIVFFHFSSVLFDNRIILYCTQCQILFG